MTPTTESTTVPDATPGRASGFATWRAQALAFARRSVRELFRNRPVLFWSVAFPVGFYLLTITVFVDTSAVPADAVPYVKAGTAVSYGMFGAIIASLNAFGQQLAVDLERDRYRLYRSLPLAPSADLAGRMVAGVALAALALVAALGTAILTGATFSLRAATSLPVIAVAFVTFAVVWMVAAVLIATVVRESRYASIITVSIALAAYFLTGYNGGDPAAFQGPHVLLNWLPNTLASRLVTHHLVVVPGDLAAAGATGSSLPVPGDAFGLAVLGGTALVSLVVGVAVLRRGIYKQGVAP